MYLEGVQSMPSSNMPLWPKDYVDRAFGKKADARKTLPPLPTVLLERIEHFFIPFPKKL